MDPAACEGYPVLDEGSIGRLEPERGWLVSPRQAHLGFVRLLRALGRRLDRSRATPLNHPDEICIQFDKPVCQRVLSEGNFPVPHFFETVADYAELRERAKEQTG